MESINYSHITTTSSEIIKELISNGVVLSIVDKQLIIDKVYSVIISASEWQSNGCDCGQVNCQFCE